MLLPVRNNKLVTRRLVAIYIFFGSVGFVFSDFLLENFLDNSFLLSRWATGRGLLFVLITSAFFYVQLRQGWSQAELIKREKQAYEAKTEALFAALSEALFILDRQGRDRQIIPTQTTATYQPIAEATGKTIDEVLLPVQTDHFYQLIERVIDTQQTLQTEYSLLINNRLVWFSASISPFSKQSVIWVAHDITEQKQAHHALQNSPKRSRLLKEISRREHAEAELRKHFALNFPHQGDRKGDEAQLSHPAFHDPLTALPNKTWLLKRLRELISLAKDKHTSTFAIFLLELERFEVVNSSLGDQIAEQLLIATAQRLQKYLCLSEPVAQVGDKTLAIIFQDLGATDDALPLVNTIHQQLSLPFQLEGRELFSPASMGIALTTAPEWECQKPEELLRAAEMAMHNTKREEWSYTVFHPDMHNGAIARLQLETEFRQAIKRQQLKVFYQPTVALDSGKVTGFEALVRWQHPQQGIVLPDQFIPLAEETGLMALIDWWVLSEACRQLKIWQQSGKSSEALTMSVNLSGQLLSEQRVIERLGEVLSSTSITPGSLRLEVTERAIMEHDATEIGMLNQLKGMGVELLIDDFGTGYSSLERLHQLPIDKLKVDRSFVNRMAEEKGTHEIVRSIVALAHRLNMDVIAEGLETPEQLLKLRSLPCEYGQGYLFSKPLAGESAAALLTSPEMMNYEL